MSFTHTSWQKLLSDLSQLFSLSPPALSKEVSSKCLFCSQFSICFSIPSRECCDMTNRQHYTQDESRFVKEGAAFGTAAREGPGDVALGWEVPFPRASSEQLWNQWGSSRQSRSAWIRPTVHIWMQFVQMCLHYPTFYLVSLFEGVKESLSLTSDAPLFHDSFPVMRWICDFLICVIYCYCRFRFIFFLLCCQYINLKECATTCLKCTSWFCWFGFVLF